MTTAFGRGGEHVDGGNAISGLSPHQDCNRMRRLVPGTSCGPATTGACTASPCVPLPRLAFVLSAPSFVLITALGPGHLFCVRCVRCACLPTTAVVLSRPGAAFRHIRRMHGNPSNPSGGNFISPAGIVLAH